LNCPNCHEEMIENEDSFLCIYCKQGIMKYTKSDLSDLKNRLNDMVKQTIDFVNYKDDKVH
jgi:hypothetical protein